MCKGKGRSGLEVKSKENEAANEHKVEDRGFKKVREVE